MLRRAVLRAKIRTPDKAQMARLQGEWQPRSRAEVEPKKADWIRVEARALSAGITNPTMDGSVLDFSRKGVLKAGAPLLAGATIYPDHLASVREWVGEVEASRFIKAAGEEPAGIDATLAIDWEAEPKLARGVLAGTVHDVSVGVYFEAEKSHPELDEWEFWTHQGEKLGKDIVRLIVTEIKGFGELSLVSEGADPTAGIRAASAPAVLVGAGAAKTARMTTSQKELEGMDLKKIAAALGLEDASESAILAAIESKKEKPDHAAALREALELERATMETERKRFREERCEAYILGLMEKSAKGEPINADKLGKIRTHWMGGNELIAKDLGEAYLNAAMAVPAGPETAAHPEMKEIMERAKKRAEASAALLRAAGAQDIRVSEDGTKIISAVRKDGRKVTYSDKEV